MAQIDTDANTQRLVRRSGFVIPAAGLGGLLAAAAVMAVQFTASTGYETPIDRETVERVEFLSTADDALEEAVHAACAYTGCIPEETLRVLRAEAAAMTVAELEDALRDVARELGEIDARFDLETADAAALQAESTAQGEIATLYRAELRRR